MKAIRPALAKHTFRLRMQAFIKVARARVDEYGTLAFARSKDAIGFVSQRLTMLTLVWLAFLCLLSLARVALSPTPPITAGNYLELFIPYALVAASPILGFIIGREAFRGRARLRPSSVHFAIYGRWKTLRPIDAVRHQSFGPIGFMASLVIGMMLNVVLRTGEFLLAIPALTSAAPDWGLALFWLVTLDTVIMNFFYMVCFAMALRSVPLFPKMLLFVWIIDITMQLGVANTMSQFELSPAVAGGLGDLIHGNITKVLISAAVWLPYLILSERVNVTFRHRVSAA